MTVTAKFQVHRVATQDGMTQVAMRPVYHENNPEHPNRKFWEATPSGQLDMTITNPAAANYFEDGAVYLLTFEKEAADEKTAA